MTERCEFLKLNNSIQKKGKTYKQSNKKDNCEVFVINFEKDIFLPCFLLRTHHLDITFYIY